MKFALRRVENIVQKGENAGLLPFSLFHKMFSKGFFFFQGHWKSLLCGKGERDERILMFHFKYILARKSNKVSEYLNLQ